MWWVQVEKEGKEMKDILAEIEEVRDGVVEAVVEDMVVEMRRRAKRVLPVMSGMIPDAVRVVYEVMKFGTQADGMRFKSATWLLGVFGISDRGVHEEGVGDRGPERGRVLEDLKNEFRRAIEEDRRVKRAGTIGAIEGVKEGEVSGESGGTLPGSS